MCNKTDQPEVQPEVQPEIRVGYACMGCEYFGWKQKPEYKSPYCKKYLGSSIANHMGMVCPCWEAKKKPFKEREYDES